MRINRYDNDDVILKNLGHRIKEYRVKMAITQNELAERSGVSLRTISSIENGKDASFTNIIRILKILDLSERLNDLIPDNDYVPLKSVPKPKQRYRKNNKETEWKWGDEE